MIKPGEIQSIASTLGLRDTQIEKDYIIGWVLKGMANNKFLSEKIIFKGGTALRKIYYKDYRLSEDLDFTSTDEIDTTKIRSELESIYKYVGEESRIKLGIENEVVHNTGNFNFYITYIGPLGGTDKSIKVDISSDEKLSTNPIQRKVLNLYTDLKEEYKILSYTLDEIIVEKMRSLMQRTIPRDLYDLWYLFNEEGLNIEDFVFNFIPKAESKGYDYKNLVKVVTAKMKIFKKSWENSLSNQMREIPNFDDVWRELNSHWRKYDKFVKGSE